MSELLLRCHPRFELGGKLGLSRHLEVVDRTGEVAKDYDFMCDCIDSDIESAEGSGAICLD